MEKEINATAISQGVKMQINTIEEYFHLLGYDNNDRLSLMAKSPEVIRGVRTVGGLCQWVNTEGNDEKKEDCYYAGAVMKGDSSTSATNIAYMKEFILDIDVGSEGHKKQTAFQTIEEALAFLKKNFPVPTAIISTGGGLQIHYRLADKPTVADYEAISKRLQSRFKKEIDSCTSAAQVFRLPFSWNCKIPENPRAVKILEVNDIEYELKDFETYTDSTCLELLSENSNDEVCKSKKETSIKLKALLGAVSKKNESDRSELAFNIIAEAIRTIPAISDKTLSSCIKKNRSIFEHYNGEQHLLQDIRRIRGKIRAETITPVMPVEEMIIPDGYSLAHIESARNAFDNVIFNSRQAKFETTLSILDMLYKGKNNGILNVPCSSGKTFASIIFLAHLAQQGKRTWLVSEKIEDCRRNAQLLQQMGVNAVGWHGRTESCPVPKNQFFKKGKPCKSCAQKCGAELKYSSNNKFDHPDATVICCTHQNYKAALVSNAIPQDLSLIVIDESPNLLETFSYTDNELSILKKQLSGNQNLKDLLNADIYESVEKKLVDDGVYKIDKLGILDYKDEILNNAFMNFSSGRIDENELDFIFEFLRFFSNENIYCMSSKHSYSFMTGKIRVNTSVPTIVLDGSARNQSTCWDGFKIYTCDKLKTAYPNMKILCIPKNPTQNNLSRKEIFRSIKHTALRQVPNGSNVIIFANKDLSEKESINDNIAGLKKLLQKKKCQIIDLSRGQHIGSNAGREGDSALLTMSLFTTVSDYALRAAVYSQRDIPESAIFDRKNKMIVPKIKKNGHFSHDAINDQYIRTLERDLYQAIMRGKIRDNPNAAYTVVALVSSPAVVEILKEDMPSVSVELVGDDVYNLYLEGFSESEIAQKTGKSKQTVHATLKNFI